MAYRLESTMTRNYARTLYAPERSGSVQNFVFILGRSVSSTTVFFLVQKNSNGRGASRMPQRPRVTQPSR